MDGEEIHGVARSWLDQRCYNGMPLPALESWFAKRGQEIRQDINAGLRLHRTYNVGGPGWVLFILDRLEKALCSVVRI